MEMIDIHLNETEFLLFSKPKFGKVIWMKPNNTYWRRKICNFSVSRRKLIGCQVCSAICLYSIGIHSTCEVRLIYKNNILLTNSSAEIKFSSDKKYIIFVL